MEGYIHASNQIKQDLALEYMKVYGCSSQDEVLRTSTNGKMVFDNIEIVFRNSAKQRVFSSRVQGDKADLQIDDLIPAYFTTSDTESYNDCLNAIGSCKRINYFLFTNRAEKFGLEQRNKYSDSLRRLEQVAPDQAVKIYNVKKDLIGAMLEGRADYAKVQPLVEGYVKSIGVMLHAQQDIYQCESALCKGFLEYVTEKVETSWFGADFKLESAAVKALLQVFEAMTKRGMDIPKIKEKLNIEIIEQAKTEISDHIEAVNSEIDVLGHVVAFINHVVKYMERPGHAETADSDGSKPFTRTEGYSSRFLEWLTGG